MSAIAVLNDAVGGVTVTVPEDFEDAGPEYKKGETLHLDGSQAESFVRWRNSEEDGSNNQRISRQKQYLTEFIRTASKAVQEDYTLPVELYQGLSDGDRPESGQSSVPGHRGSGYGVQRRKPDHTPGQGGKGQCV